MFNAVRVAVFPLAARAFGGPSRSITTTSRLLAGDGIYKIQSSQEFEDKVKNIEGPVIVDFFATYVFICSRRYLNVAVRNETFFYLYRWCNPCKMLTPRIESVIGENAGKITLAKVRLLFLFVFVF